MIEEGQNREGGFRPVPLHNVFLRAVKKRQCKFRCCLKVNNTKKSNSVNLLVDQNSGHQHAEKVSVRCSKVNGNEVPRRQGTKVEGGSDNVFSICDNDNGK